MKQGPFVYTVSALIAVAMVVVVRLAAQDMPGFSGHWVLESASTSAADIPRALWMRMSPAPTTTDGEQRPLVEGITVVRETVVGTTLETYQIGVAGGIVSGNTDKRSDGSTSHYRVGLDNKSLIIESGTYTGPARESGEWSERREDWFLDSNGRLIVKVTTRGSSRVSTAAGGLRSDRHTCAF